MFTLQKKNVHVHLKGKPHAENLSIYSHAMFGSIIPELQAAILIFASSPNSLD